MAFKPIIKCYLRKKKNLLLNGFHMPWAKYIKILAPDHICFEIRVAISKVLCFAKLFISYNTSTLKKIKKLKTIGKLFTQKLLTGTHHNFEGGIQIWKDNSLEQLALFI